MSEQELHPLPHPDQVEVQPQGHPGEAGLLPESAPLLSPAGEVGGEAVPEGGNGHPSETSNRHVVAGRKGAQRVHQLIQHGRLYEQEHGLKRGRQRLRQLIEEGKLYEQEHGLRPSGQGRASRPRRMRSGQVLRTFGQALLQMVRPKYRDKLARMLQALEAEGQ
jgi:hypothetical protein